MGRKIIDETNKTYGKLTVLKRIGIDSHKHTIWLCGCECGETIPVQVAHLRNGHTTSCGCGKHINEVGNRYGKLVVVRKSGNDSFGKLLWECYCDCGTTTIVRANTLRSGEVNSCGCIKSLGELKITQLLLKNNIPFLKEYSFQDLKSENNYPLRFDFAILNIDGALQYLIEYDGAQHFESIAFFDKNTSFEVRQNRDKLKNDYCQKNNIRLIRLSYKDQISLDKIL